MENEPLVSVVTTFLNAQRFLAEAIDSVLAQEYRRWELLLVDDGSTDESAHIAREYCARYPNRIRYLHHPEFANRGLSASRNVGIGAAQGEFIALLDADDVWLPSKLERQVAILRANPEAGMVYGAAAYWHGWTGRPEDIALDHVPVLGIEANVLHPPPTLAERLHPLGQGTAPCPSDLMVRQTVVERLGAFDESFRGDYQLFEDQAFLAKVYLHSPVYASDEIWIRYRIHPDSISSSAARRGSDRAARHFFLQWLTQYFQKEQVAGPELWAALRRAMEEAASGNSRLRARWNLRAVEPCAARLVWPGGDDDAVRVAITATTGTAFDVQINLPNLRLEGGRRYVVHFEARSDEKRPARLGVAEAHAPWAGLGWHQVVELTPEWKTFEDEFVATKDEPNARIHVDLGEYPISAELRAVGLRRLPEGTAVEPEEIAEASDALLGGLRRLTPLSRNWGFERGQPVDRWYIDRFLARNAVDIHGRVLEIEDNTYTGRFGGDRVTTSDILHVEPGNPRATLVGDLAHAPHLPSRAFDAVILTQTLHLIFDTRAALATLRRLLKPGGVLLATFPGLSKVSNQEWAGRWYWGFTTASARRLFEEAFGPDLKVEAFGNVLTSIAFLEGMAAEELRPDELEHHDPEYELLITVRAVAREEPR